jgi:hypothetical protein
MTFAKLRTGDDDDAVLVHGVLVTEEVLNDQGHVQDKGQHEEEQAVPRREAV